jgi:hypothetical protein
MSITFKHIVNKSVRTLVFKDRGKRTAVLDYIVFLQNLDPFDDYFYPLPT